MGAGTVSGTALCSRRDGRTTRHPSQHGSEPDTNIRLYAQRFATETTFRALKQSLGAFAYHFWSWSMSRLNRYRQSDEAEPLDQVTDRHAQERILHTVKAIEGSMMCHCIAMGLLQMIALRKESQRKSKLFRFLRTPSKGIASEATIMAHLRQTIFSTGCPKPAFNPNTNHSGKAGNT